MDKLSKMKGKLLVAAALILPITLLSACNIRGSTLGALGIRITTTTLGAIGNRTITPLTACHATDNPANPYEELTVNSAELNVHRGHPNDIIPAPANGCPASPVLTSDGKITICHATGGQTNPYNQITVSVNGLNGHDRHEGDIIPTLGEGCPTSPEAIYPGTSSDGKITICHATGSKTNPYNEITVSVNGLNGHGDHEGDIIPAPEDGCPGK